LFEYSQESIFGGSTAKKLTVLEGARRF